MQNLRSNAWSALTSWLMFAGRSTGGGNPLRAPAVRGELLALLMPLASELEGVGCSSSADKLALFEEGPLTPLVSECELLGGETESVRLGGVWMIGWLVEGALETALMPGS